MIKEYKSVVTFVLIGINVLIFFLETAAGGSEDVNIALKFGAMYTPYVLEDGKWYTIVTSMFVHYGINHIAGNMLALLAVGHHAEFYFGKVRFLIIYFVSGICGNLLSILVELHTQNYAVSAGASGAISGLIGTFLILSLDKATKEQFPLWRVLIGIALVLIPSARNVNVAAHAGGMIAGIAVSWTMYYYMKKNGSFIEKIEDGFNDPYKISNGQDDPYRMNNGQTDPYQINGGSVDSYQMNEGQADSHQINGGSVDSYRMNEGQADSHQINGGNDDPYNK